MRDPRARAAICTLLALDAGCADDGPSIGTAGETTTGGPTSFPTPPDEPDAPAPTTTDAPDSTGPATSAPDGSTGPSGPYCGDMHVDPGEACDEGPILNHDQNYCTFDCTLNVCGDGKLFKGVEACDLGPANSAAYGGCDPATCTPNARCGDGIVQYEHEECDLGPDNGVDVTDEVHVPCSVTCSAAARLVFVTSEVYTGDLGGLDGADAKCQALAAAQNLAGAESFRAWLSAGDGSPTTRFALGPEAAGVPYALRNGQRVADDFAALLFPGPLRGVFVTEKGDEVWGEFVWTNTTVKGNPTHPEHHCDHWGAGSPDFKASHGFNAVPAEPADVFAAWQQSGAWTDLDTMLCDQKARLYCFEQALPF